MRNQGCENSAGDERPDRLLIFRMRILFVNRYRGEGLYGIERWMLDMATALGAAGHISIFAVRPGTQFERATRERGFTTTPIDIRVGTGWLTSWRFRRFLARERIDHIVVKTFKEARVLGLAALGLGVPVWARRGTTGDVQDRLKTRMLFALTGMRVICPAQALRGEFIKVPWLPAERVVVVPHGIDLRDYQDILPAPELPNAPLRVVTVGRLHPSKGIDVLLNAWSKVVTQFPEAELMLVGGEGEARYRQLAHSLGILERVRFVGYQRDVRPFLGASDLLVLASRAEGFPYTLLQAMAMGKPVIATRISGTVECVEDGTSGVLVPVEDVEAIATAIVRLLKDKALRDSMGQAGKRLVATRFSWDESMKTFLRALKAASPLVAPERASPR